MKGVTGRFPTRHEADMDLREREQTVSGVLAAATEYSIIGTDLDGTIIVFNSGAERMLGYRADELVGLHTPELIHDADEVAARAMELGITPGFDVFTGAAREGRAETREWTFVRKDGSRLPVELTVTATLDDDLQPRGFIGIAVDLTERRSAEAALRAAYDEVAIMEKAFTDAPCGVALISLDGGVMVRVNAALCEILGRSEDELIGATAEDFSHPDDRGLSAAAYAETSAGTQRVRMQKRYLKPDGSVVWAMSQVSTVGMVDGHPTHIVAHVNDVTAQHLAEQELRVSEANLRTVAAVARGLPGHESPRQAICDAAATIGGADAVQLWEPDGAGFLCATTSTGLPLSDDLRLPISPGVSTTVEAFVTGQRYTILDARAPNPGFTHHLRKRLGGAAAVFEPVIGKEGPLGVLVIIWNAPLTETADRDIQAVGLLATEAAAAIERADMSARLNQQTEREQMRLRQILDGAPDAMLIIDTAGIIQMVNERAVELFGFSREEMAGSTLELVIPEAASDPHADHRAPFAAAPGPLVMSEDRERIALRKDGTEIQVSISLSPVATDQGQVVVAAVRDITARQTVYEQLRAAEEQFHRAFDDAPVGMMMTDLEGHYMQVNDAFCAIVGYPRETLIGLARQAITHPDDVAHDEEMKRSLLDGTAKSQMWEKRFIHAGGQAVWVSMSQTAIRSGTGKPTHFITQTQDITDRRRYESQLKHMAEHDPLTGLLNRRSFERELASHVSRIKRSGPRGAVLMIDLDNFKYYNDTEGHSAGDDLIVRIGHALKARIRESEVLARLGGDEFAALLPDADEADAETVARAMLDVVAAEAPSPVHGNRKRVTASIGIASFSDGDGLTGETIIVNADLAMYQAKENGRSGYAHYRTEEHERPRIESQMNWARQINDALSEDRFELLAQPITPLGKQGSIQYELLLRMRNAVGEQTPPGTFIYIAERLGLIQELDRWVVTRAIDMLAEQRACGRDLRFEVNLSGHTLGDPQLLELIESKLGETGVPPDRLILEITETAAVADIARASSFAQRLSELGCRFALDDFGAGFGSFYYLKHLPFDYLKIDGEFVRDCTRNKTDRVLISSVVQIARGLGKSTIAEFVQDQESLDLLTELGVDYGQGYFLGRPAPLAVHLEAARGGRAEPADATGPPQGVDSRTLRTSA